jgi:2-oxo-4-hydroxy-4-carboxy--5-ureidoimidazoline (OHCU) decarboxylase
LSTTRSAGVTGGPLPSAAEIDPLDDEAFARAIAPLFEGAPRFVSRLTGARPFGTWDAFLDRAAAIASSLPEAELVELLDSHPRIGAPRGEVSPLSFREQGYDREEDASAAELQATLDRLNAAYEARFGFRFLVHVAGRPRAALVPLLEASLDAERDDELRRAARDVVAIARDRVRAMRPEEG